MKLSEKVEGLCLCDNSNCQNRRIQIIQEIQTLEEKVAKYDELQKVIAGNLEKMEVIPANTIEKARNWDMLERLPECEIVFNFGSWHFDIFSASDTYLGKTPAEALKKYWDSCEQE